jgi:uncharacterized membrane protein SpoIIM required for sporulation
MGKRIRKKWDLPSERLRAAGILGLCFLLGGLAGQVFVRLCGGSGGENLRVYLREYLRLAQEGTPVRVLWPILWEQLRYFFLTLLLGWTAAGVVGLPVLFAVRGFFLSFSVACFCLIFGQTGLVPAFVLFGLPALFWVPALFLLGSQGLSNAWGLFRPRVGRTWEPTGVDWRCVGFCFLLILLCGFLEYSIIPDLLGAVARFVL